MRFLSLIMVLLCLLVVGCSDDSDTKTDGGGDAVIVEAGIDAITDDAAADAPQAGDLGAGEQATGLDAASESGTDQGEAQ